MVLPSSQDICINFSKKDSRFGWLPTQAADEKPPSADAEAEVGEGEVPEAAESTKPDAPLMLEEVGQYGGPEMVGVVTSEIG